MDPQQKDIADEFDRYNASYVEEVDKALGVTPFKVDFFTRAKAGYLLDLLTGHAEDVSVLKVLDVGCGVGNYHPLINWKVGRLVGVDVSTSCIETAKFLNPGVEYSSYDGVRLPYENSSFDVAFAICVMHHVPPHVRLGFLTEMQRVLRPGGLAVIFEHNPLNPLTLRVVNRCPFDENAVLLKASETTALMVAAGFANVDKRFILTIPVSTNLLRPLDRVFSKLGLGAQYYALGRSTGALKA